MPRKPSASKATIARVVMAAQAAGMKVGRLEVEGDRIVIYPGEVAAPQPASDLDAWRAKRNARAS